MILDKLGTFITDGAVGDADVGDGAVLLGDVIDLGGVTNYPGDGEPIYMILKVDTQIITGGVAGTLTFDLMSGPEEAITTTPTTHHSRTILTDDATAINAAIAAGTANAQGNTANGIIWKIALPMGAYQRYLGIKATALTADTTAGAITAFLTRDPNAWKALPREASAPAE